MMPLISTNTNAFFGVIIPAGISRIAVLGFFSSYFLSTYRLNAMAALRAVIMQMSTNKNLYPENDVRFILSACIIVYKPNVKPIKANGSAKTVCENFTKER